MSTTTTWAPGPDPFLRDPEPVNVLDADHPDPSIARRDYHARQREAARIEREHRERSNR